ncbi:MAG TPA: DUF1080 domain-containing protein [Gemmatimonadaceae bacterium]|nr:DUF1080 domain-containing protein [Gemmatimonadaceae bacterium]
MRRLLALLTLFASTALAQRAPEWPVHSMQRPQPPVVRPGGMSSVLPPSDAIVLFDGRSLAEWRLADDSTRPARWLVRQGYMEAVPGAGSIQTRRAFGDVQLHLEFATPERVQGSGQERGNSGVFLMGRYEVQILDSFGNQTYPDGQAAAIFGQRPPLANASRPPGAWQSLDIVFRRPHFDRAGRVVRPARLTVVHNGVLVHDAVELTGPTAFQARPPYAAHPARLPLSLQEHGQGVRFRNVWVREP